MIAFKAHTGVTPHAYVKAHRMTPTEFRNGGNGHLIRFAITGCWLGEILVACTERGVCSILLGHDTEALRGELRRRFPRATLTEGGSNFEDIVNQVVRFVETPNIGLDLPLDVRGSAFQHRVWQALLEIPAGQTSTYGEIAHRIGRPNAQRAVAQACAGNQIAVAIPCHRIVRSDGAIAGYRWGSWRKQRLLDRESQAGDEA